MKDRSELELTGSRGLGSRYFTTQEVFDLETERIFGRQWLCIGRAEEIQKPGDYRTCQIEGEPLLLVRGDDGRVRCFANVCRHRGALLCEPAAGRAQTFTCPYHRWTYDLRGNLVAGPTVERGQLDTTGLGLAEVAVESWHGLVFVNLAPRPPDLAQTYAPLAERLDAWKLGELVEAGRLEYRVAANWKVLFQNYNECYHCPFVHPALNRMSAFDSADNDLLSGRFLGGPMELADGVESMTTSRRACGTRLPGLSSDQARRVYYYTCFPTLFISPHPDFVLLHRLHREAVDSTRVVCHFLFLANAAGKDGFDPRPAVEFWDLTNRQDWEVCERVQRGLASPRYEPGPYSKWERVLVEFDRHYLEVLGE
jgi:Rieske 2Fe-2S family protein